MKLLLLADVSGSTSHVGDEAMLEANIALLRRLLPTCEIQVAAGANWKSNRLGVEAVPRLEFSRHSEAEREAMLASLSEGSMADHPAVNAALACDALIISGGGNLSKSWPHHIYERLAMARQAASKGAKIIILGQTLGPEFRLREQELVTELMRHSIWTGLRETYSYTLALELGARRETLSYQQDDAAFLEPESPPEDVLQKLGMQDGKPWIGVTAHPIGDASIHNPVIARMASCLKSIADTTATDLVFIPHVSFAVPGVTADDEAFGAALNRALYGNPAMRIAPVLPAAQALWLTQRASLIISTRYHPLVFGLAGGVPSIGMWSDEYTRRKLQGALIHLGRSADALPLDDALAGRVVTKALELWRMRSSIGVELQDRIRVSSDAEEIRTAKLRDCLLARET